MKALNNRKGIGMLEVLIAIIIIAIMAILGFEAHVFVRSELEEQERRMTALNLANSQIEHLKETVRNNGYNIPALDTGTGYPSTLDAVSMPPGFTLADITYDVIHHDWSEDSDTSDYDYVEIIATCTYSSPIVGSYVQLRGFIVEDPFSSL